VAIRFFSIYKENNSRRCEALGRSSTNFKAWLRQRNRWFRGWIQSLVKYLRVLSRPSVTKRIGFINTLSIISMLIAPLIVVLNWIAYSMTTYWLLEYLGIVPFKLTIDLFPWWVILPPSFNAIYYYTWIAGAVLEGIATAKVLIKYIPHMIYYMNFMMPIAAFRAFYQEIFKEVFWEKTKHLGRGVKWMTIEKQQ